MSARILVVEDEEALLEGVAYALEGEGHQVDRAGDGEYALALAAREAYDAVVLDLMLPGLSGTEVCRRLRAESAVPILMLTARDSRADLLLGLEIGADDYMTKPFDVEELLARVRALLRRRELDRRETRPAILQLGGVRIDRARCEVVVDDRHVPLTPSELKVLSLLGEHPEQVFSKRQILEHLWDSTYVGDEHACDIHISNLRRKIERDPRHPERLVTVRGFGYKLVPA